MPWTKIIETLRKRGDDALADELAAEFGETTAKAAAPSVKGLLSDLDNLEDFVTSLGMKSGDKKVIKSGFRDLKAGIQKLAS